MLFMAAFAVYPLATTILNSFRQVSVGGLITGNLPFVGMANYTDLFGDDRFSRAVVLAVIFTLSSVVAQFVLGLGLAVLLNRHFAGRRVLQAFLVVPWVLPVIVVTITFKWMFQSGNGVVNALLGALDPTLEVGWLEEAAPALIAIIIANVWWGFPFVFSNASAALQTIPHSVLEAAQVDGASPARRFWSVVLPMIRGPVLVIVTMQVILTVNVFELVLVMTGGGPAGATSILSYYIYQLGFNFYDIGAASAATVVLLVALTVLSAAYIRFTTRGERAR